MIKRLLGGFVSDIAVDDIDFTTDNRLDTANFVAFLGQFDGAIHHTMVGDGHGRHILSLRLFDQVFDHSGAVQQAVLSMQMKRYVRTRTHQASPA
ncbi:MAG: hypothetical protein BWY75_01830 [bacterium ADurb.Bin425]|nr:MAG: hypothetical protein BWY75_01830 [bacterium ADurb.Bin425]